MSGRISVAILIVVFYIFIKKLFYEIKKNSFDLKDHYKLKKKKKQYIMIYYLDLVSYIQKGLS